MKYCTGHLHDLRKQLDRKGLSRLIHPERAGEFGQRWVQGTAKAHEFDPMVVAMLEIGAKCRQLGIEFTDRACPLCAVNVGLKRPDAASSWTDNVTDLMVVVAQTNGLVS